MNEVAAHGVPGRTALRPGDLVSVDVVADMGGWKSDAGWTFGVLPTPPERLRLIEAAWRCTRAGVLAVRPGGRVGDIGAAICGEATSLGCSVVELFAGHAIGREIHEEPLVPHTGQVGTGRALEAGMVLNIEPVVTFGSPEVDAMGDGWGYRTRDRSPTAQYELTVAVGEEGSRLLNIGGRDPAELPELPPFY